MGDKPAFLKHIPLLSRERKLTAGQHWRCALASLVGVDRSVASVYDAVKKAGELRQTVFIYISDNGLFHGQHRLANGKVLPYEEALRLPLVIDIPSRYRSGQGHVRGIRKPVANIDLAPTMLDLAHGSPCPPAGPCRTMDGRSLMPLLDGTGQWPHDRGLLTEYRATPPRYLACQYDGIRTRKSTYVEYHSVVDPKAHACHDTFEVERYGLKQDPFELKNLCHGGTIAKCPTDEEQADLEQRLQQLSQCAGVAGRDGQVDGRPFCE
jgi:arylsulfatase A-like enzyme